MKHKRIAILGLGYVGLPLAIGLSKSYDVIGYDIDSNRIIELRKGIDKTLEIDKSTIKKQLDKKLFLTSDINDLTDCNFYIATVPTPISNKNLIFGP